MPRHKRRIGPGAGILSELWQAPERYSDRFKKDTNPDYYAYK